MDREEHSMKINNLKKPGLFAAGVLFGTAGIKILTSKDAKKLYTNCTAAVLRAKSCIMKTATTVQETARIYMLMLRQSMRQSITQKKLYLIQ